MDNKTQDYETWYKKSLEMQNIELAKILVNYNYPKSVELMAERKQILDDIMNAYKDENQYLSLLTKILNNGNYHEDRTGVGTYSIFGTRMEFNIQHRFPLFTTKNVYFRAVAAELLWFLKGDTNVKFLHDNGCHIWDEWADDKGDLGPIYGKQWRDWNGDNIDQIQNAVDLLRKDPGSRRIIISAWNPSQLSEMALPPCHMMCQFYADKHPWTNEYMLSCQVYQRSADMFLGVPFNIASYSLLTYMMAAVTGMKPDKLIWVGGDTHIYTNHLQQVNRQLHRKPYEPPQLKLPIKDSIFDYKLEDFEIINYKRHASIKAPVAV